MGKKVFWRSYSRLEADFELSRIKSLPLEHEWVNAHIYEVEDESIYLTANGHDHKNGNFSKASVYAESYTYLRWAYDMWHIDNRWDHRFHFNPHFNGPGCSYHGIGTWWQVEIGLYNELKKNKDIKHQFGMVLGVKGEKTNPYDIGFLRSDIVREGRDRSFRYFGLGWPDNDPNYGGEAYVSGNRSTPLKFHDARCLMSDVKFVFALENTFDKLYSINYLTEKIWHAFLSRSVPIYVGCWNVEELLPGLFIDLREFDLDIKKVMDFCERMPDSVYNDYLNKIEEFLNGPGLAYSCDDRFLQLDRKLTQVLP